MNPTPYSDLNQVLAELLLGIQTILGKSLVGLYLQGSFAVGDFDRHSDVDFIVVTENDIPVHQVDELQKMHDQIYQLASNWAQHLEGSYFPKNILRAFSKRDQLLWYLDNGARSLIKSDHCNTAVVRWVLREKGITLVGPPPNTLVDPISEDVLTAEIYETMNTWGQEILSDPEQYNNRFYQGFIVLSYCRMLHDLQSGKISSKQESAAWAKAHLDPGWSDLIDSAWATRPDPAQQVRQPADPQAFDKTLKFLKYILQQSQTFKAIQ